MPSNKRLPQTLLEAIRYFEDPDVCVEFVAGLRWPNGPVCPSCEGTEHSYLSTRRVWKCKKCKKQFSVKVGTIFEDSAIPLDKWLASIWLVANSKNGIASHELARSVGITQKSAWFVLHRIRLAMQTGTFDKLSGEVEMDETFIGGKPRKGQVKNKQEARLWTEQKKTKVFGMVERGGRVYARVIPDREARTIMPHVRERVDPDALIYTDEWKSYRGLPREGYRHKRVNHASKNYVIGDAHTQTIENFWSLLKRGLKGTYVAVAPVHLARYLDERMFTFNERAHNDFGRFAIVLAAISGRRLTYAALIGKA